MQLSELNNQHAAANYQAQLIDAIFNTTPTTDSAQFNENGLAIYRNNLLMTAARALSICYPVVTQMIGEQMVPTLAKRLLMQEKPSTGDWADWGESLAKVIYNSELQRDYPFLTEIAEMERALFCSERGHQKTFEVSTLQEMAITPIEQVIPVLNTTVYLIGSYFSLDKIWEYHNPRYQNSSSTNGELQEILIINEVETHWVIAQQNGIARFWTVDKDEFNWLIAIRHKASLDQLLNRHPDFDFVRWLSKAIQLGWLSHIQCQTN